MTPYHKIIWKSIDRILLEVWDPLELGTSSPSDEYQTYTPAVFSLKIGNASLDQIADLLLEMEKSKLGLPGEERRCRNAAMKIVRL